MKDSERDHLKVKSPQWLAREARIQRDVLLAECDWVVLRAIEAGAPVPAAWLNYRRELRDLPTQAGFPNSITWPQKP